MQSEIKELLQNWLPPAVLRWLSKSRGLVFQGKYPAWSDAAVHCSGYDSQDILSKVLAATLKVKRGEAAFERDSIIFSEPEYEWPLLAALMWAAARTGGKLNVLDFGGALGSSYFQNKVFLESIPDVMWSVVEQSHYVDAGQMHIQDNQIRFYKTIEACTADNQPNVILLSSVLQYIESPDLIINQLKKIGADFLIIDRTPFSEQWEDRLVIQSIPASIYRASYPMWIISRPRLERELAKDWNLIASHLSPEGKVKTKEGFMFSFEGMLLESIR